MKRLGFLPVLLLAGSLLVLLVMFALRGIDVRNQREQFNQTQTSVALTVVIQQTEAAIPTDTPRPTSTTTLEPSETPLPPTETVPPSPTQQAATVDPNCDVAEFSMDVTVPDGTVFDPDTKFTKTWRLYNNGTCSWNSRYKLYFVSGDKMSGPDSQSLTSVVVPPGSSIDVSVELRAPKEEGTYRGNWALKNANGFEFGVGPASKPFYVEIVVVGP
jgi:hypothetical protein